MQAGDTRPSKGRPKPARDDEQLALDAIDPKATG
jgi:hypothetical protein